MSARNAFTLVELLVVIAIVAILIGLLLPAVQKVREAANRADCANNLKQLGVALHNYESANRALPPGMVGKYGTPTTQDLRGNWGWAAFLLPYMEQNNVYDQIGSLRDANDMVWAVDDPSAHDAMRNGFSSFRCRSDTAPGPLNSLRRFDGSTQTGVVLALSNYVANNGPGAPNNSPMGDQRGPFYEDSQTRLADIGDGTSNTIAFGERAWSRRLLKSVDSVKDITGASVIFGCRGRTPGSGIGIGDVLGAGYAINYIGGPNDQPSWISSRAMRAYGSNHTGGANFVFLDGSVSFLTDNIDADLGADQVRTTNDIDSCWEALLSQSDGTVYGRDCD